MCEWTYMAPIHAGQVEISSWPFERASIKGVVSRLLLLVSRGVNKIIFMFSKAKEREKWTGWLVSEPRSLSLKVSGSISKGKMNVRRAGLFLLPSRHQHHHRKRIERGNMNGKSAHAKISVWLPLAAQAETKREEKSFNNALDKTLEWEGEGKQ